LAPPPRGVIVENGPKRLFQDTFRPSRAGGHTARLLAVHGCSSLLLAAAGCSWLFLAGARCSCLLLGATSCSCWSWLILAAPGWLLLSGSSSLLLAADGCSCCSGVAYPPTRMWQCFEIPRCRQCCSSGYFCCSDVAAPDCSCLLQAARGWRWLFLAAPGSCWLLLLLLAAPGYSWLLQLASGCSSCPAVESPHADVDLLRSS